MCARTFFFLLGRSDCLALRGLALVGLLDVLAVHVDVILDHSVMADGITALWALACASCSCWALPIVAL